MQKLNKYEFEIIQDKDFLLAKAHALSKIELMLTDTRKKLKKALTQNALPYPKPSDFKTSKISKGENYLGLPYMVLDFPAVFSKDNIFAFRSMFWWANFFSSTLHLQGQFLDHYRNAIIHNFEMLEHQEIYIGVGDTPWHYHYGKDNYKLLGPNHKNHIEKCYFLKLSKKFSLKEWHSFPLSATSFYQKVVTSLTHE